MRDARQKSHRHHSVYSNKKDADKLKKKSKKHAKSSKKSSRMSSPRGHKPQQQSKAPRTELDYEIERLKAEIQQERQMK